MKTDTEVKVGVIAGFAEVIAASITLFGVLVTAGDGQTQAGGTSSQSADTSASSTLSGESNVPCTDIIERYRALVFLDPTLLDALVVSGPDEISPIEADPDARRCGISEDALRAMR